MEGGNGSFSHRKLSRLGKHELTQFSDFFSNQKEVNLVLNVSEQTQKLWKAHQNYYELKAGGNS